MKRGLTTIALVGLFLLGTGCSSLWPWGGPDLPKPAPLPEKDKADSWWPDLKFPSIDLWPFDADHEGPPPDLSHGVEAVSNEAVVAFYARAELFYGRLEGRRFNTLTTYRDPFFQEFFQSPRAHADYYAGLAHSLRLAHFEQNTPVTLEVLELRLEGPGSAVVRTRMTGENDKPLRWWKTTFEREDHWERVDGTWWLVPGTI